MHYSYIAEIGIFLTASGLTVHVESPSAVLSLKQSNGFLLDLQYNPVAKEITFLKGSAVEASVISLVEVNVNGQSLITRALKT